MKKGDKFSITVYDDVLTYEVEERQVVLPTNVKPLAIQEGRDLVSLVTCTPYGVNSHRLILTAHRIPTPENKKEVEVNPGARDHERYRDHRVRDRGRRRVHGDDRDHAAAA